MKESIIVTTSKDVITIISIWTPLVLEYVPNFLLSNLSKFLLVDLITILKHGDYKLFIPVHKYSGDLVFYYIEFYCQILVHFFEEIYWVRLVLPGLLLVHFLYVKNLYFFRSLNLASDVACILFIFNVGLEKVVTDFLILVGWNNKFLGSIAITLRHHLVDVVHGLDFLAVRAGQMRRLGADLHEEPDHFRWPVEKSEARLWPASGGRCRVRALKIHQNGFNWPISGDHGFDNYLIFFFQPQLFTIDNMHWAI